MPFKITGKVTSSFTLPSNDCANLVGTLPATGTLNVRWTSTPRIADQNSSLTVSSLTGNPFVEAWNDAYALFTFGISGGTRSFMGTDGGATSSVIAETGENLSNILTLCASGGVKKVHLGPGEVKAQ